MDTVLIKEKYGISLWCPNTFSIKLCFSNIVLCMSIPEVRDFMRALYHACPIEKNTTEGREVCVYILPTPIPTLQLAFTENEQMYILEFCKKSIRLAERLVLAN